MGSSALAGVQTAVASVGVMTPPVASSRGTSLTAGALWATRRSCGSQRGPPGSRSPSSGPAPTTWVSSRVPRVSRPHCVPGLLGLPSTPRVQQSRQAQGREGGRQPGGRGGSGARTEDSPACPGLQLSEALGAGPSSTGTGPWILQGPTRPAGPSSSTTGLLERRAPGRACRPRAPRRSLWTST